MSISVLKPFIPSGKDFELSPVATCPKGSIVHSVHGQTLGRRR